VLAHEIILDMVLHVHEVTKSESVSPESILGIQKEISAF
jgi:hypothetical protein